MNQNLPEWARDYYATHEDTEHVFPVDSMWVHKMPEEKQAVIYRPAC
jgi:hypothetical protein